MGNPLILLQSNIAKPGQSGCAPYLTRNNACHFIEFPIHSLHAFVEIHEPTAFCKTGHSILYGCRNFLPAHRCEGGIRLDGWDILLPLHAVGERATVAVPDGAITVEGGTHTARVSRVIRDLNATAVVLRAAEAPDVPPLCVVLPEGVRAAEGDTLSFSLLADRCRLWEE